MYLIRGKWKSQQWFLLLRAYNDDCHGNETVSRKNDTKNVRKISAEPSIHNKKKSFKKC